VSPFLLSATALAALCAAFAIVYVVARRIDNFGIVDIAWSYAFAAIAAYYALFGGGWPERRALIAAMAVAWSLRLGTHLLVRIARKHPEEDGRYRQLRKDWGSAFRLKMAGFFQLQAASVVLLGFPFLAACSNPAPTSGPSNGPAPLCGSSPSAARRSRTRSWRGSSGNREVPGGCAK
jgi:steroid 5-alpha reductase family enzyme